MKMGVYKPKSVNLSAIDGFDTDSVASVFGMPKIGKSLFLIQMATDIASQMGKNVLLVDTEGGAERFVNLWLDRFNKRMNSNVKFEVVMRRTIEGVLGFHGIQSSKRISEVTEKNGVVKGGKIELVLKGFVEPEIEKVIEQKNIGIVIYDSLTEPLRVFGNRQENYPARADATGYLFDGIFGMMDKYQVLVFATHHQTLNPANPYAVPDMRGGNVVHHLSKTVLYMDGWDKKSMRDYRKMYVVRYYNIPSWKKVMYFTIKDDGFYSVTEDEVFKAYKG